MFNEHYKNLEAFIKVLIENEHINSLIVVGDVGLGKSFQTLKILDKLKLKRGKDYEYLSGYITPLQFYMKLYSFEKKKMRVVVIDDMPNLFKNDIAYSTLLSLLQTNNEQRWVGYDTTSNKLKVKSSFKASFKVIFLANGLNGKYRALKSRSFIYDMNKDFDFKRRMKLIKDFCELMKYPEVIWKFIKNNVDEINEEISLRLPVRFYAVYKSLGEEGLKMLKNHLIEKVEELKLIAELLKKHEKVMDAEREFMEITGRSRATFYRLRAEYLKMKGEYKRYKRIKSDTQRANVSM